MSDRTSSAAPPALRGARAAFTFLSRLPVGGFPYCSADWRWAPAHFPLVGAAVGGLSCGVYWLAAPLGGFMAAVLALAASMLATGAFHEDGLADSADALGTSGDRQRLLEILKDSRIGTYGALALLTSTLLRVGAMAELGRERVFALVLVHCLARVGPVWLLATEPYVSLGSSKGAHVATGVTQAGVALSYGVFALGLTLALGWLSAPAALGLALACVLVTLASARYFRARLGGVSGDLLGASEQVTEIALWLVLCAIWAR